MNKYSSFSYMPSFYSPIVNADRGIFDSYIEHATIADKYSKEAPFYQKRSKYNRFASLSEPSIIANPPAVISGFRRYCSDCHLSADSIDDNTIEDWLSDSGF